ncbi:aminotransferase class III-fold pyridoxal phosphate-dependent enzyme [Hoeflea sp. G2-23]|uniref:Aminotransferase class III-fold pyridoxal phosphate-dependent enzyme n=1 Tax=Hoeflea algicola TaxID=2983763 RepID=A0ABT3ZDE1_9HYPH|nr:aminotransferase class III-fold pyridoxal phosphate-dependent enzyme [Hoeflea algicola]MCY0149817.1 aminotransferase class III-fold pyridoxal phosphate-dependent enzyme [Hoeflea algicola]
MSQIELVNAWAKATPGPSWGYMNLPAQLSPVIVRGNGARVFDASGKSYVDHLLSSGPLIVGHAHPVVVEAVTDQLSRGSAYFAINMPAIELAQEILGASLCGDTLHYQTTGSEATAAALRIARAATGRSKVIKFEGGFHGSHDLAQLSNDAVVDRPAPMINPSSAGGSPGMCQDALIAVYNDITSVEALVAQNRDNIACVIIEPIQRAIMPQPGFLEQLRALTHKEGILLIYDEVVTGFRVAWGGLKRCSGSFLILPAMERRLVGVPSFGRCWPS